MGLDMYLYRKQHFGSWEGEVEVAVKQQDKQQTITSPSATVETEVGYWRKANAVHKWFVERGDGEDNCRPIYIGANDLEELLALCRKVKATAKVEGDTITNADEIADLLPTQAGFFFGSTDYGDWYLRDIDYTIEILERVLAEHAELVADGVKEYDIDYEYQASW